jgi:serine/threonine protein kinase/Flp pilus assembly protein TadD
MTESSSDREPLEQLAESFLARFRAGERPSLTEITAAHPELADQIRELFPALVEMEQAGPADGPARGLASPRARGDGARPESLGGYRLIREIGRGGMGVVYEAEQEALGRRVALKVLPSGLAGDAQARARFDREARAAAKLHHTNIVPVFDVGHAVGRDYYAMQMIRGQGLDAVVAEVKRFRGQGGGPAPATKIAASLVLGRFAAADLAGTDEGAGAAGGMGPTADYPGSAPSSAVLPGQSDLASAVEDHRTYYRGVARIGQQVATALTYAHARGVIHRDIKPSNLLLDTAGIVWVTDFGLAKTADPGMTGTGDILGTIRYMAPERFRGECDARADIYALGLTLYELLALEPAFSSADRLQLIEQIRSEEPRAPRSFDRKVPRDLETIVLKAIAKEPRQRYPSAEDLGEDLQRFLADEPVQARRIGPPERLARWARRNPAVAGLAAAVFLVMAAGTAVSAWQASRARTAEAAALNSAAAEKTQRAAAEEQEAETRAVLEFVENKIFAAARPEHQEGGLGREISLRKALESSLAHIPESFRTRPLTEARLRHTLGLSFLYLGESPIAKEQFEAARLLFTKYRGADHPDALTSMNNLAITYNDLGRRAEAIELREEILGLSKAKLGPDHPNTLGRMENLAVSYEIVGRPADALKLREEALTLQKAKLGPDHPNTLMGMLNLAISYRFLGRQAEALKLCETALALQKAKLGPDHPDTLHGMFDLANYYVALGRSAEALDLREKTLELRKVKLGPDHPDTLISMSNLASSYEAADRFAEALKLAEQVLELRKAKLGRDHPDTLLSQMHVASALMRAGRAVEGVMLARQAAELWEGRKGTDAFSLYTAARCRAMCARVLREVPKSPESAKKADQEADLAMAWLTQAVAAGSIDAAHIEADHYLGSLRDRADFQALLVSQLAKAIKSHPKLATAWSDRGAAYVRLRQWQEAIDDCSEAVKLDPKLTRAWILRGEAYLGEGDWEKAAADYGQVLTLDPNDDWPWYPTAALRLQIGDTEGYRRICRDVLARFGNRAQLAERISKTCLLIPDAVSDLGEVFKLADRAVTGTEQQPYYRWFVLTKSLAEYRAGHDAGAQAWLTRFSPGADGVHCDATAFSVLAMAQHRLGRAEAARDALGHARAILTKKMPDPGAGRPFTADPPFSTGQATDWLHAAILFREAEAVVGADKKTNRNDTRE